MFVYALNNLNYFICGITQSIANFCCRIKGISLSVFQCLTFQHKPTSLENRKFVSQSESAESDIISTIDDTAIAILGKEKAAWNAVTKACLENKLAEDFFDQSLYSPLQAAVLLQDLNLSKRLVKLGFSINNPENSCKHPVLSIALRQIPDEMYKVRYQCQKLKASEELALFLIENGADLTYQTPEGHTYLHFAVVQKYEKVCKLLLEKGLDVNKAAIDPHDYRKVPIITPLLRAVKGKSVSITRLLLEKGASYPAIKFVDNYHNNPFYIALDNGEEALIQAFLDNGAQLDQEVDWVLNNTPLLHAVNNPTVYALALKIGINLERKFGIFQKTYLHFAAESEKAKEIIPLLLQKGANARVLDLEGKTPLILFQNKNNLETHAELEKADNGLTSLMTSLRLLGLRFSLQGNAFEGMLPGLTYEEVARSLENYLKNQKDLPPFFYTLPRIIRHSASITEKDTYLQLGQNGIVSIASGWTAFFGGHATALVLTNQFLIKGNRGEACDEESGVTIDKINNPSNLSEAVKRIFSNRDLAEKLLMREEDQIEFFKNGLNDLLGLEKFLYIHKKEQVVGNCAWFAAIMALLGCVIAHYLQENPSIEHKEILKLCNSFISSWKEYDLLSSLEVLEKIENEPIIKEFMDLEEIYDELFIVNFHNKEILEKLCQLRPRLLQWVENPDPKLMHYAYKHGKSKIVKIFFDKGAKADLIGLLNCYDAKTIKLNCEYFTKQGIKANILDALGITPLHALCIKCNQLPKVFVPLTMKLLESWKKECELSGDLQPLKDALNIKNVIVNTEGLTPLQMLIKDNKNLTLCSPLIDLMKQYGATTEL